MRRESSILATVATALAGFGVSWSGQPAAAAAVDVIVHDLEFVPFQVIAAPGDTVRFVWGGGYHTATSGAACRPDGVFFDSPIDPDNQLLEFVIPDDFEGVIPYFCVPHCRMGMKGLIIVKENPVPGDIDGDGFVNGSDLGLFLGSWGFCEDCGGSPCLADLNSTCTVDAGDLAMLLDHWTG